MHRNVKRRPWNAASFADKEKAVSFIKNFAEAHALPLPGRMPKFYDYSIMLLPSDVSKASVHRDYVEAIKKVEETIQKPIRCFGYREFCCLWSEVVLLSCITMLEVLHIWKYPQCKCISYMT